MGDEVGKSRRAAEPYGRYPEYRRRENAEPMHDLLSAFLSQYQRISVCTEETGVLYSPPAELRHENGLLKLFVDGKRVYYGGKNAPIAIDRSGVGGRRTIYLPHREVRFRRNADNPANRVAFIRTIGHMIVDINKTVSGRFNEICGGDSAQLNARPTLYVVGRTDRIASEEHNQDLSERRARTVAEAIDARKDEMKKFFIGGGDMELAIKYIGVGESQTKTEDDVASPGDRRVDLMISSVGPPFQADWKDLAPKPEPEEDPQMKIYWDFLLQE